jgi:hypothetical protein
MLHACAARFDVTENLENFLDFGGEGFNHVSGQLFIAPHEET